MEWGMKPEVVISILCPHCGARLPWDPDHDRFECSYCGTTAIAQKNGEFGKVGPERLAAELALVRLGKEWDANQEAVQTIESHDVLTPAFVAGVLAFLTGSVICAIATSEPLLGFSGAAGAALGVWTTVQVGRDRARERTAALTPLLAEGEEIQRKWKAARRVVDG
jgi:hypothetical protein